MVALQPSSDEHPRVRLAGFLWGHTARRKGQHSPQSYRAKGRAQPLFLHLPFTPSAIPQRSHYTAQMALSQDLAGQPG